VAWPPPLSLFEVIDGEPAVLERLLLLESPVAVEFVLVVVLSAWSAACAARPTPRVPARLAAIKAPVMTVVRLRPWSRFMFSPSLLVDGSINMPDGVFCGLCCS
jgi:hypothetical protein